MEVVERMMEQRTSEWIMNGWERLAFLESTRSYDKILKIKAKVEDEGFAWGRDLSFGKKLVSSPYWRLTVTCAPRASVKIYAVRDVDRMAQRSVKICPWAWRWRSQRSWPVMSRYFKWNLLQEASRITWIEGRAPESSSFDLISGEMKSRTIYWDADCSDKKLRI